MAQKILFSCIFFFQNENIAPVKYRSVTNLKTMFEYADKIEKVKSMNIYHKKSKAFIIQVHSASEASQFYHQLPSKYE